MLEIRPMTLGDVPLGMRLKEQAGWNQTEADWRRFLDLNPGGSFVAVLDGREVGTTVTTVFDSVAWVAMVLIDPVARGNGVGTSLLQHALDYLRSPRQVGGNGPGVASIRLDATAMGKPIYEKLDFVVEYELTRFEGTLEAASGGHSSGSAAAELSVRSAQAADIAALTALDQQVTGEKRCGLLRHLLDEFPQALRVCCHAGQPIGYAASRPGTLATQIGPVIALSDPAGIALLDDAARSHAGQRVFIDVPQACAAGEQWAHEHGLTAQRPLVRMGLGPRVADVPAQIFASSGPEKG